MGLQRRRHLDRGSPLDPNLAERYLSGALAPDDLPPALGPLASVIEALRPGAEQGDALRSDSMHADAMRTEREQRTIDSMVSLLSHAAEHPVRRLWLRFRTPFLPRPLGGFRVRLATSVVAVMLAFLLGAAYGQLPGPAQNVASVVLAKVGLDVPRHDAHPQDDRSGESEEQGPVGPDPNGPAHDGLCNAYFHGRGGEEGGKYDSVAFQNVQKAAADASQTVEQFCGVEPGSEEEATNDGGSDHEHGRGSQKSKDDAQDEQSGDQGQDEQSGDQGQDEQPGDQGQDEQSGGQGQEEQSGDQGDQGNAGDPGDGGSNDAGSQGGGAVDDAQDSSSSS